jgi:hypothetical protein
MWGSDRHHLRVDDEAEVRFWAACDAGAGMDVSALAAGLTFDRLPVAGSPIR